MGTTDSRPCYINATQAARMLGVSVKMVYKMIHLGQLQGHWVGKAAIIYRESVERRLAEGRFGTSPEEGPKTESAW